jgi:hypothetical protein
VWGHNSVLGIFKYFGDNLSSVRGRRLSIMFCILESSSVLLVSRWPTTRTISERFADLTQSTTGCLRKPFTTADGFNGKSTISARIFSKNLL